VFGRLHPTNVSRTSAADHGAVTLPFFFSLGQLVSWLIQVQILLPVWQCAAVILLRRYRSISPSRSACGCIQCPRSSARHVDLHLPVGALRIVGGVSGRRGWAFAIFEKRGRA
jgi:hypothetical protein